MSATFHLFERFGVELEYMLVRPADLAVAPIADRLLRAQAGAPEAEVEAGDLCWSNELVRHVVELKTNGPVESLAGLEERFQAGVGAIQALLEPEGACLLPGGMHPTMNPMRDTHLWPFEYNEIYQTFDRIFNCRGHGWANLQSTHLNLPFANDEEFGRLHAAIRVLLPILPALTASSPIVEGEATGLADTRLEVYRTNARRIPSVAGRVIPEPVYTRADYIEQVLEPIYRDLRPHDPQGVLRYEWVNARGAIARFERNTIEIRVLDVQESPRVDLAMLRLIVAVLRGLVEERWSSWREQAAWAVGLLERIFLSAIRTAERAPLDDAAYLRLFGAAGGDVRTAGDLWRHLFHGVFSARERNERELAPLVTVFEQGCLAHRILAATELESETADAGGHRPGIAGVYSALMGCLADGRVFDARAYLRERSAEPQPAAGVAGLPETG